MNIQNLDLMITGSFNDMQSLPVFIGNTLLSATSTFFPILILFVSFFILYKAIGTQGNYVAKLRAISPYLASIILIGSLLSMYTKSETGSSELMKNTKNYFITEIISTGTIIGPIFADYLTHAILYGSSLLNKDNNQFNGWFAANLDESLEAANKENKEIEENKKLLSKYTDSKELFAEITRTNNNLAPKVYTYVNDLYDAGIILSHNNTLGKDAIGGNFTKSYDSDANYFIQLNVNNNQALNKRNYQDTLSDLTKTQIDNSQADRIARNNIKQNNTDDTLKMYTDEIIADSKASDLQDFEINLTNAFQKYMRDYSSYDQRDIRKALSLLYPLNLSKEVESVKIWKETSDKHFKLFKFYSEQLLEVNTELSKLSNESRNDKKRKALEVVVRSLISNLVAIKDTVSKVALAYKDTLTYFKNLSENYLSNDFYYQSMYDSNFISKINQTMGDTNYFSNIAKGSVITKDDVAKLNDAYLLLRKDTVLAIESFSREALKNSKNAKSVTNVLNARLESKRVVLTYLFNRTKEILQNDLILQKKLGLEFDSPFARVFMPEDVYNTHVALDNTKRGLRAKYLTNATSAANKLTQDLTNFDPKLKESPISWYQLGANYGTFKLVFAKSLTDSMLLSNINNVDRESDLLLLKDLQALDPKANANRVLNGLAAYNTLKATEEFVNITKKVVIGNADKAIKTSNNSGSLFSPLADMFTGTMAIYGIMYLINVILPAVFFMAAVFMYYIDVLVIVAFLPIIFIFMIFQSYHGTTFSILKTLLGLILMPIGIVVMFFIILYIDILSAYFVKVMLPFFNTDQGFINSINIAMGGNTGFINTTVGKTLEYASAGTQALTGNGFMQYVGPAIYTIISFVISVILFTYFFKVNDYITKLFNVSLIGSNVFNENSMKSLTNKTPLRKN
jgi:hypothetical protein